MIVKIQHRRGSYNDYDPSKVLPGELVVTQSGDPNSSDGEAVYIGTKAGKVKQLATSNELDSKIATALQSAIPEFIDEATQEAQDAADRAEAAAENLVIDDTLTVAGRAADAKKTGDEISQLKDDLSEITDTHQQMIDKSSCVKIDAYISLSSLNVVSSDNTKTLYFACEPNTEYTVHKVASARFRVGYTTVTPDSEVQVYELIVEDSATSITITTGGDAEYLVAYYYDSQNDTLAESEIYNSIEITYGREITAFDEVARTGVNNLTPRMLAVENGKVDKQQAVEDAGKVLAVNDAGVLTPVEFVDGLTDEAKTALLSCFQHVVWTDEHGQDYYNDLEDALYGGVSDMLTVTLNLGTHEVYPTDNIESLRNYLTVVYNDETPVVVTNYTLRGDISAVGTQEVYAEYEGYRTRFNVPVVANTNGLLYEWDFTESLTDKRQLQTAVLLTGEAIDIPGKSEGTTPPVRNSTGVVFDDAQQILRLIGIDTNVSQFLLNKTIQVDIASFIPVDTTNPLRLLTTSWIKTNGYKSNELGIVYNSQGCNLCYSKTDSQSNVSFDYELLSSNASRTALSGQTLSIYIDSTAKWKLRIGSTLIGISSESVPNTLMPDVYGLQIGNGARVAYGGTFYNATVTGVRIYTGDVANAS